MPEIDADSKKADILISEYEDILNRLDQQVENNALSSFSRGVIIKLIREVNEKLTNKYRNVNKRVGDYMGGKVLDLDIIKAHDAGIEQGIEQGIDKAFDVFKRLISGESRESILKLGVPAKDVEEAEKLIKKQKNSISII